MGDEFLDLLRSGMFGEGDADFSIINKGTDASTVGVCVLGVGGKEGVTDLVVGVEHGAGCGSASSRRVACSLTCAPKWVVGMAAIVRGDAVGGFNVIMNVLEDFGVKGEDVLWATDGA